MNFGVSGDGGFNINVAGNTSLTGAVITSTQQAHEQGKNSFNIGTRDADGNLIAGTGSLTITDIHNSASYTASASNFSAGLSVGKDAQTGQSKTTPSGSAGVGSASASSSSVTAGGITGIAGDTTVVTGKDTTNALAPIFDADAVKKDVNAQVQITAQFGSNASKAWGTYSDKKQQEARTPEDKAGWAEGGSCRAAGHVLIGGLTSGSGGGAVAAGAVSLGAPLLNDLQSSLSSGLQSLGLDKSLADGLAALASGGIATGVGSALGGLGGGAAALNADFNNRQLHPSERQKAKELAAKSGGKYTAKQIEEQMRLMGNSHTGQGANTLDIATTGEQNAQRIANDPSLPVQVQGNIVIEVPGTYNAEIQNYIIDNTQQGTGYIPGQSPYVASNPQAGGSAASDSKSPRPNEGSTVACGNMDLDCKSGVGVDRSEPVLTPEQRQSAGDFFAKASTDYQRLAAISAATGNAPVTLSFEIAAGVTGLLEQAFDPSAGKVIVDTAIDEAASRFAKRTGIPMPVVFEVVEREIKPRFEAARQAIDQAAGRKK